MPGSARLSAYLKCQFVHNGLDRLGCTRMFFGVVEHDRQYKGTCVFLHRHPFIREQHAGTAIYIDNMVIVIH